MIASTREVRYSIVSMNRESVLSILWLIMICGVNAPTTCRLVVLKDKA